LRHQAADQRVLFFNGLTGHQHVADEFLYDGHRFIRRGVRRSGHPLRGFGRDQIKLSFPVWQDKGIKENQLGDLISRFGRSRLEQETRAGVPDQHHRLRLPFHNARDLVHVIIKCDFRSVVLG
jgi:hypothetical protein